MTVSAGEKRKGIPWILAASGSVRSWAEWSELPSTRSGAGITANKGSKRVGGAIESWLKRPAEAKLG